MSAFNIAYINSPTVPLAVTTTSARAAAQPSDFAYITNLGTAATYVKSGDVTVVAVVDTNMVILSGQTVVLRRDNKDTHIAAITSTGTASLSISSTQGR